MKTVAFLALVSVTRLTLAVPCSPEVIAGETYPTDVREFVSRRDLCDHFRGEEPYDAERRHFLERSMNRFCTGTDRQLARLKEKYRDNAHILDKLNEYERNIEGESN